MENIINIINDSLGYDRDGNSIMIQDVLKMDDVIFCDDIELKDNIKLWRNDDGIVIMGIQEFLLNKNSLDI